MLALKAGVRIHGLAPEMVLAALVIHSVYAKYGYDCTVTAGIDGPHSRASLHYTGQALDFRMRDVPLKSQPDLAAAIRTALGEDYDVVVETTHLHVEWQPKRGYF